MKWLFEVIAATGVILGAIRVIYEMTTLTKTRLKDNYQFAKDFLEHLERTPNTHHLVMDRGYYALAGTTAISVAEIAYLIRLTNPDKSLRTYVQSRKYLEIKHDHHKIGLRQKYKTAWSRGWRKAVYFFLYLFGACLSMSPFILQKPLGQAPEFLLMMLVTLPSFGFLAFDSLRAFMKIKSAEELVHDQSEHVQKIVVPQTSQVSNLSRLPRER